MTFSFPNSFSYKYKSFSNWILIHTNTQKYEVCVEVMVFDWEVRAALSNYTPKYSEICTVCVCVHTWECVLRTSPMPTLNCFFVCLFVCLFVCIFSITAPQVEKEWWLECSYVLQYLVMSYAVSQCLKCFMISDILWCLRMFHDVSCQWYLMVVVSYVLLCLAWSFMPSYGIQGTLSWCFCLMSHFL